MHTKYSTSKNLFLESQKTTLSIMDLNNKMFLIKVPLKIMSIAFNMQAINLCLDIISVAEQFFTQNKESKSLQGEIYKELANQKQDLHREYVDILQRENDLQDRRSKYIADSIV